MVILQRENGGGAHINHAHTNKSGNTAERAIKAQRAMRVVILQRKYDSVAHINESGDIAERAMRWRTNQ